MFTVFVAPVQQALTMLIFADKTIGYRQIMTKMRLIVLVATGLVSVLTIQAWAQDQAATVAPLPVAAAAPAGAAAVLPRLPVKIVEGEINLGYMYGFEKRCFSFTVKNLSDKALGFSRIIVSCSCSKVDVKPGGEIGPHAELIVPVELEASKISERGAFEKGVWFEFPGYETLPLIFRGEMSSDLQLMAITDGGSEPAQSLFVSYIPNINDTWERTFELVATFKDDRKLDFGQAVCGPAHTCEVTRIDDLHWRVRVWPRIPQSLGMIDNVVRIPMLSPNPGSWLELPIEGMVGALLESSVDELYVEPLQDSATVKKTFALTRLPFNYRVLRVRMALGGANPYAEVIPTLRPEEVSASPVPGIQFEFEQGSGGVYVHCTMVPAKMGKEAHEVHFSVSGCLPIKVNFGVMTAAIKQRLADKDRVDD